MVTANSIPTTASVAALAAVSEKAMASARMPAQITAAVNARRHPPRLIANKRDGMPYIAYPLARENPQFVDVICDDVVEMTLQYSTQWDSLAHIGQLFDADGDGTVHDRNWIVDECLTLHPCLEDGPERLTD